MHYLVCYAAVHLKFDCYLFFTELITFSRNSPFFIHRNRSLSMTTQKCEKKKCQITFTITHNCHRIRLNKAQQQPS